MGGTYKIYIKPYIVIISWNKWITNMFFFSKDFKTYYSMVYPYFMYGNEACGCAKKPLSNKIKMIRNRAIKNVMTDYLKNTKPIFTKHHILRFRILFYLYIAKQMQLCCTKNSSQVHLLIFFRVIHTFMITILGNKKSASFTRFAK